MKFDLNQNIVHSNTTIPKSVLGIPKKQSVFGGSARESIKLKVYPQTVFIAWLYRKLIKPKDPMLGVPA